MSNLSAAQRRTQTQRADVDILGQRIDFYQRRLYSVINRKGQGEKPNEWSLVPFAETALPGEPVPHVVSSLTAGKRGDTDTWHAPCLDIDYPVSVNSRNPDNFTVVLPLHDSLTDDDLETLRIAFGPGKFADWFGTLVQGLDRWALHLSYGQKIGGHVVQSSTPGHFHLYINTRVKWANYQFLLECLGETQVISASYAEFSIARRESYLRFPGVTKVQLPSPSSEKTRLTMSKS